MSVCDANTHILLSNTFPEALFSGSFSHVLFPPSLCLYFFFLQQAHALGQHLVAEANCSLHEENALMILSFRGGSGAGSF